VRQDLGYIDHVEGPPRHPLPSHQGPSSGDHGRARERILRTTGERSSHPPRTSRAPDQARRATTGSIT
jgi:hypothetical protein